MRKVTCARAPAPPRTSHSGCLDDAAKAVHQSWLREMTDYAKGQSPNQLIMLGARGRQLAGGHPRVPCPQAGTRGDVPTPVRCARAGTEGFFGMDDPHKNMNPGVELACGAASLRQLRVPRGASA